MKLSVFNLNNEQTGDISLDDSIFAIPVRSDIMARVVKWQLAKRQAGTHSTKTRGTVKHTTKKPFKQKGTGAARQGMKSAPNMRHGGIAMGPLPHSHEHSLPKKVRNLGLKSALSSKIQAGKFIVVDSLSSKIEKTSTIENNLKKMNVNSALFIDAMPNDNFCKSCSNLVNVDFLPVIGANVYDILGHDTLFVTKEGMVALTERLK